MTAKESKGRDSAGKFAPGHKGGPGRPPKEKERSYLDATITTVTIPLWIKIIDRALADALKGDHRARAWLAELVIGKGEIEARIAALEDRLLGQDKPGNNG